MSSSFGGGGQGDIKYVISVDDSQAVQKLQSFSQSVTQLGNSTSQATQQVGQMPQTLDEVATSSDKVAQSTDKTTTAFEQQGQKARQAKEEQMTFGQTLKNNITNIVQIGTGILGLVSNYTSLQRAQLSINKLEVTEANQRRLLDVLTRKHAEAVAQYGANSQEALDIENKINILQAKHTNTVEQLSIRQDQLNQSYIGFGISLVSTGAGIVQAATGLKTYRGAAEAATIATTKLTNASRILKASMIVLLPLVGLEIAAQAIANNWGGFRDWLTEVYNWLVKLAPAFKPVIDALYTIGEAITAIFTFDTDKLQKMFSGQTAEGATAAAGGLEMMGEEAAEAGKEIQKLKETVEEFQKVGTQLIVEASQGNRGEQRDFLKLLGIKGNEKEKMRDVLDAVEDAQTETQQAAAKLEALEGFNILEKLGFDIPDDVIEDIQNTIDSDLRDIISGDNDPFNKLADILEESPNKEKYGETLATWATENPGLLEALRKFDPRLAAAIDSYIATFQTTAQTKLDQVKLTLKPGSMLLMEDPASQEIKDKAWDDAFEEDGKGKTLFDQLFEGFTPTNVKKRLGEVMGQISDAITDPEFWHAIGATALQALFTIAGGFNTYVMPWLSMIAETLTDVKFWQAIGTTALGTFFAIDVAFNKYVTPWLAEIAKTLTDPKFWQAIGETALSLLFDIAKSIGRYVLPVLSEIAKTIGDPKFWNALGETALELLWQGWESISDWGQKVKDWVLRQLQSQVTNFMKIGEYVGGWILGGIMKIVPNLNAPKTKEEEQNQENFMKKPWDTQSAITNGTKTQPVFALGSGDLFGDFGVYSKDIAGQLKPIFPGAGFGGSPTLGQNGKNSNEQIPISYSPFGVDEDKGKEINGLDQMARQLVQLTKNMNTFAQTIVQVTKNINTWAKATVTQTKDNDQLARTIAQITKNNNTFAKTIVTVTKDLNQQARATVTQTKDFNQLAKAVVQNTKNNNTFAKTIVETTKDFNQMARGVNQNTKNLNTFARAVNQTTSNVKKLTNALNDIPTNVKSTIRVGLSGAGSPFLDQLI